MTLGRPPRVRARGEDRYEVDGTPTDCVHPGVFHLTGGRPPDLILSGINRGLNIGDAAAIREVYVSVTPLHANMTHDPSRSWLESWDIALP